MTPSLSKVVAHHARALKQSGFWVALAALGSGILLTEVNRLQAGWLPGDQRVNSFIRVLTIEGRPSVVLLAVFVAPVVEELVFRRGLLGLLLFSYPPARAITVGACFFALAHFNLPQLVPAFWMGLLFGWVYVRTRSWLTCVAGHAAWNAQWWLANSVFGGIVPGYTIAPTTDGTFTRQPWWWVLAGLAFLALALTSIKRRTTPAAD